MSASNLQSALSQAALMVPRQGTPIKTCTRYQIAKRVFELAAAGGFPYTGMTYKQWAKKWLPSHTFRLMEIDINAAASPHLPRNPERVAYRLLCSADSMDPIVVDKNRQKVGRSHLGYIPRIVVTDGKHRKQAMIVQGRTKILAWVGCDAERHIKNATVIEKLDLSKVKPGIVHSQTSPAVTAYALHCATVPATGQVMLDQSGGERGSRPRPAMVKADKKIKSTGGMGGPGSLGGGSGSNPATMNIKSGGPGSGRHKWTQSKVTGEHLYKSAGYARGYSGGTYGRISPPWSGSKDQTFSVRTFGPTGFQKQANSLAEAKQMVEDHMAKQDAKKGLNASASMCACHQNKSMGVLDDASTSDKKVPPDQSDSGSRTESSDQRQWLFPKEQIIAPGAPGWEQATAGSAHDPQDEQPGSGIGPRVKRNTGATKSEMSRLIDTVTNVKAGLNAEGKLVKRIYTKAPPGMENMVMELKKQYGEDSSTPFKIAWDKYGKGKDKSV